MLKNSPLNMSMSLTVMCVLSFFLILLLGTFLLQVGVRANFVGVLLLGFLAGLYIFSGILAKTMRLPDYQTADRTALPFHSGQSLASGMISSGIFIFLAGEVYEFGADALASFSGWILGACLMVVLFAGAINRSPHVTLTSLLHDGRERSFSRLLTMIVIVAVALPLLLLQFSMASYIGEFFFGLTPADSIFIMSFAIGICLLLGGIQSLSVARTLAYPIIALTFLIPLVLISYKITGNPFPHFAYGAGALDPILQIDKEITEAGFQNEERIFSLTKSRGTDLFVYLSTLICLACGTAAMPHLLQHFNTLKSPYAARLSGIWGIALLLLVITAIPAYAAFYRVDIYTSLLGLQLSEISTEAPWLYSVSGLGAFNTIAICGEYVTSLDSILSACNQSEDYFLSADDISINPLLLILSSGVLNDLFPIFTWVLVIGALVAVWSTADGIILSIANTLSHDGYVNILRPTSPKSMRLFISRFALVAVLAGCSTLAIMTNFPAKQLFEVSFALSAASVFLPLLARVWFKTTHHIVILSGMVAGFLVTCVLLFFSIYGPDYRINSGDEIVLSFNPDTVLLSLMPCGFFGMVACFFTMVLVQVMCTYRAKKQVAKRDMDHASSEPKAV